MYRCMQVIYRAAAPWPKPIVQIGGVSAKDGEYETIVETRETIEEWRHYEYEYTIPSEMEQIRFELNVLEPGTFWIDEITISGISDV